ncbi:hypothetical protein D2T29_12235 [Sinirhodobacter populi]|uniref:Uncharacterized protein n=1 Tax=Paenirhodobacter populi TaxID=2306993 RepID=A0A443KCB9_9RHOB|nr:hypothetical protein [Sinirhodobacter populi]RWR30434.1 hypothetical protein D2T29_12235 [Sinirhodobacter populi]
MKTSLTMAAQPLDVAALSDALLLSDIVTDETVLNFLMWRSIVVHHMRFAVAQGDIARVELCDDLYDKIADAIDQLTMNWMPDYLPPCMDDFPCAD